MRKVNQNFNRKWPTFFYNHKRLSFLCLNKETTERVLIRHRWKRPYLYTSFADVQQSNCTRVLKAHLGWLHFDIHLFNILSYCGTSCPILSESVILLSLICIIKVVISGFSVYVYINHTYFNALHVFYTISVSVLRLICLWIYKRYTQPQCKLH